MACVGLAGLFGLAAARAGLVEAVFGELSAMVLGGQEGVEILEWEKTATGRRAGMAADFDL